MEAFEARSLVDAHRVERAAVTIADRLPNNPTAANLLMIFGGMIASAREANRDL
jgi:tRNA A37 threonylcarbamoyladenosine synthetase subunit TsaC/SUA5/YrdC